MLSLMSGIHSEWHQNFGDSLCWRHEQGLLQITTFLPDCTVSRLTRELLSHFFSFFPSFLPFFSSFFFFSSLSISFLHVQVHVCITQAIEVIKSPAVCIAYGCDCTGITKYCKYIVIGLETWALGGGADWVVVFLSFLWWLPGNKICGWRYFVAS